MSSLILAVPDISWEEEIRSYRSAFPEERMRVTYHADRIPGMDGLEQFRSIHEWIGYVHSVSGTISWYMALRPGERKIIGFSCLRHSLAYDDDDPEFSSHIGYSIRPDERRRGYGTEQLRLVLGRAKALGLNTVRIICRDINTTSCRTILANGGIYIDSIYGSESGLTVNRYDVPTI